MSGSWTKTAIQRWGAVALIVASALPAAAQTTSGGVTGTVHDEQGAAIPSATATLTSNTRGTVLTAGINGSGNFVFATVPPDTYTLSVKADGFKAVERTVLRGRQLIREGKAKSADETELPVALGLATQEGFPYQGTINFVDNQVNPKTGTLRVRGVFPNKDQSLSPGFFARVRVPIGPPRPALLVTDRAIDNDQGQKILYVVNDKNEVMSRPIRAGALHDGLRAIEDGLKPGERVVVNGLQLVRPGITVEPKLVAMPTSGGKGQESGGRTQKGPARVAKTTP